MNHPCDLPARQQQILRMIAQEKTTKEIALDLGLSQKTVEWHRSGLMRRLGIFNYVGLAKAAVRLGMVDIW